MTTLEAPTLLPAPRPSIRPPRPARAHLRWIGLLAALLAAGLATVPAAAVDERWLPGDYVDYAPSGMPDFSQCRAAWSLAGSPPQWTHAGPVALADVLWWLDSAAETQPAPPEHVQDSHALVTAYPVFGRQHDDHAIANLEPLVLDLAGRLGTNRAGERGTPWTSVEPALRRYVESRGLLEHYRIEARLAPTADWLSGQVARRAGVLMLLGVWERQAPGWVRVGGHYAGLAGAGPETVLLADPLADEAGRIGRGRAQPEDPSRHSCREAPAEHDDAAIVSHDRYRLIDQPELSRSARTLEGYFDAERLGEAAAFRGQNALGIEREGAWQGGEVVMAIDAALALVPPPGATPSPTPTEVQPTRSPVPMPTLAPSASPSPARPTATARPSPSDTPGGPGGESAWIVLPWLQRGAQTGLW